MARPMTMAEKILAAHAGLDEVVSGQLIECDLDLVLANDITAPIAIKTVREIGAGVFDREKIFLVPDHYSPNKDIKSAEQTKVTRDFAHEYGITNYFEQGCMGIEHALLPEQGIVVPGDLVIGADSHTCTYGGIGAFSTGVGSTDAGVGMATGRAWFKVPETIRIVIDGDLPAGAGAKDVILHVIGLIGVDGALYCSLEFTGTTIAGLSVEGRLTIANMAIEAGGKAGIFPFDEITKTYVDDRVTKPYEPVAADEDAEYCREVDINLSELKPVVAFPHLPGNTKRVEDIKEPIEIDQVIIGSCTNGRLEDMEIAASVLKGRKVADRVRCIVIPGSPAVYKESMKRGYIDAFIDAGCAVSTPTCGPCLGGYMGIMAAGERCVSTTNRNFRGRMGHVDSEVYLAGPQVAAASAILGRIATPEEVK